MGKCLFMRKGIIHISRISGLPSGYTKLTYIESNGTQYIDTELSYDPNKDLIIETECTCVNGCTGWDGGGQFGSNSNGYWYLGSSTASTSIPTSSFTKLKVTIGVGTAGSTTLEVNQNGTTGTISRLHSAITSYTDKTYPIFAITNSSGGIGSYVSMKVKSFKITFGNTLVRDFVPCVNPNGIIGLYDRVNKKFYGNAGTGTFIGSEVA